MQDKIIKDIDSLVKDNGSVVFNRETAFIVAIKGHKICRAVQIILLETNQKDFLVESLQNKIKKITDNVTLLESIFINPDIFLFTKELGVIHRSLFADIRSVEEFLILGVFSGIFHESNVEKIRIATKIFLNILADLIGKVEENRLTKGLNNKRLDSIKEGRFSSNSDSDIKSRMDNFIEEIISEKKDNFNTETNSYSQEYSDRESYIKDTKRHNFFSKQKIVINDRNVLDSGQSNVLASKTLEIKKRRQDIQDLLKIEGRLNSMQVAEHFKGCSEKTIQRDLNFLIKKGLVRREGKKRWSVYSGIDTR